ncbi:sulfotransferase family 2 domain-containing protein [Bacillus sp. ISL-7]|uniref:sulfotransferase family 2 domain-containing protein n=1 Tax=Bacillus sp. ISL-7 TaxID=2819136 RepID=UPI001BE96CD3|nr:sulfotransferase family 2 domain-containing protein [Bacillus sp. ISL-7]MBT2737864.1 sulfotransferase family 2 domain-containing protein [Bacillus sp. ISL-7]
MSGFEKKHEIITKLITNNLPLYKKEFPLIFFWSPKGGCTSLIKWFYFQVGLLHEAIDYNPWIHFYRMEVFEKQVDYKAELAKELLNNKKSVYKLVRNPYNRAVSSFFATLGNEAILKQVFPEGIPNGLSFKQFLYRVKKIGVKKESINIHIAQQYIEGEEIFIQKYLQLEYFVTKIKDIEKQYNLLDSPIQNIIKSPHHVAPRLIVKTNQSFSEVKLSVKELRGYVPEYQFFYDEETKALVRELFKKDFEKYGYNQHDLT